MDEAASGRSASPEPLLRRSSTARRNRLALLLGRTTGRGDPQTIVRETAARQLEERRADWAYSRPVVAVDISWNIAFAVVSVSMLAVTSCERPDVPLRVWIGGYALQCIFHVALVWSEYRRRHMAVGQTAGVEERGATPNFSPVDSGEDSDDSRSGWRSQHASFAKRCESLNTMASCIWWIMGFYWINSGGDALVNNAPRLYWLVAVFLAFDICFAIFFVALAFVIGIGLCCCLPCIIAVLYAVAGQEGASDADISLLQRYRYASSSNNGEDKEETGLMIPIMNNSGCFPEESAISCEYTVVPAAKKFRSGGIAPKLEEKLNIMFSQVVATGEDSWAPSIGSLPPDVGRIQLDDVEDSIENNNSAPEELGNASPTNGNASTSSSKRRKIGKNKGLAFNLMSDLHQSTVAVKPPPVITIKKVVELISSSAELRENLELYYFALNHIKEKNNREIFMSIPEDMRVWWIIKAYENRAQ